MRSFLKSSPLIALAFSAAAQQQAPPQHAPSIKTFPQSRTEQVQAQRKKFFRNEQGPKLDWDAMPLVRRWIVVIALDEDMYEVIHVGESETNSFTAPPLPPGDYFFYADGLAADRHIGTTPVAKFNVPAPAASEGEAPPLPAPELLYPAKDQVFPPQPKIRLSWKAVKGAKSYRVQIWDTEQMHDRIRDKKLPRARWITEVDRPWLEIHDVPYASYMYLESSIYRWDVTPIDAETGKLGEMAVGRFEVSSSYYLKKGQFIFDAVGFVAPGTSYNSHSSTANNSYDYINLHYGARARARWWYLRHWGLWFDGGLRIGQVGDAGFKSMYNGGLDFAHRSNLSGDISSWILTYSLGLGLKHIHIVEAINPITKGSEPQALGPRINLMMSRRFSPFWELEIKGGIMVPAFTYGIPDGVDATHAPLNYEAGLTLVMHKYEHLAFLLGYRRDLSHLLYLPKGVHALTGGTILSNNIEFGIRLQ